MIRFLSGEDLGVPRIPEAIVLEWASGPYRVVFSYARQGNGITAHFAASPSSLRAVHLAIEDFCEWLFQSYNWCEMVFAVIGRPSIERLVIKCGFQWLTTTPPYQIYMLAR